MFFLSLGTPFIIAIPKIKQYIFPTLGRPKRILLDIIITGLSVKRINGLGGLFLKI
jgi:hypothetical protein